MAIATADESLSDVSSSASEETYEEENVTEVAKR
jgi:hypothetical protein